MSGGIRVDHGWLGDYAKTVAQGADELIQIARTANASALPPTALGQVGQAAGAIGAYHRAAALLLGRLSNAGQALQSAADNLHKIASDHMATDEEHASRLTALRPAHPST